MKLVRYGRARAEKPGLIDADGKLRDLSRVVKDITPDVLTPAGLKRLRELQPARLPLVPGKPRLGCPLAGIGKIVCIGLNYTDHAEEVGLPLPKEPTIFIKANSAISGPHDPIVRPKDAVKLDYEVELAAVIGRAGRDIPGERALDHVFGYTVVNDVTARDLQRRHGQWFKGKSLDSFCPMGPVLVTADEILDPQKLDIQLRVNGQPRQSSNTARMVFSVAQCIEVLSAGMTLEPGDIISTGTPSGVGYAGGGLLKIGDLVEAEVEQIGVLANRVVAPRESRPSEER